MSSWLSAPTSPVPAARLVPSALLVLACSGAPVGGADDDGALPASGGSAGTTGFDTGGGGPLSSGGAAAGGVEGSAGGSDSNLTGGSPSMGGAPEGSGALGSGGRASGGAATGGAPSGGQGGTGGTGSGGADGSSCPYEGHLTYELKDPEGWPPGIADKIRAAVDEALSYYNCYADLTKSLTINYKPSVPTAEANVDGWISFGSNESYMVVATTMHEIGHTLGVGYYPWSELLEDGVWIGPHVSDFMESLPAEERDPDAYSQRTYIRADTQHFWPYGLNQASEHQSEYSLINHVRIVRLMQLDKQTFLDGEL